MIARLPNRARIAIAFLLSIGLLFLWDWVEAKSTPHLIAGLLHVVLVVGLLFRLNAARVATIAASIIGAVSSLGYGVMFGLMGYAMKRSDAALPQALSGKAMNEEAITVMGAMQAVPWALMTAVLLFGAVYIYLLLYT